jgi:hypothetical protein
MPYPNTHKMKILTVLLVFVCIATSSFSQGTGDLENQFYIRLGLSQPTRSHPGFDRYGSNWDEISRIGGIFELGSIYMINSKPLADGLRLGINVDYIEFAYHYFYDSTLFYMTDGINNVTYGHFLKLTSNIGPSITYSPVTDFALDLFVKLKLPWITYINEYIEDSLTGVDDFIDFLGIGYKIGFNVRYRIFIGGFEFSTDKLKFGADYSKASLPCYNITLGFSF